MTVDLNVHFMVRHEGLASYQHVELVHRACDMSTEPMGSGNIDSVYCGSRDASHAFGIELQTL